MVGSMGNLYASVEKLDGTYVQSGAAKDALLRPTVLSPTVSAKSSILGLPATPSYPAQPKKFFRCDKQCQWDNDDYYRLDCCVGNCRNYTTNILGTACPTCNLQMNVEVTLVPSTGSGGQAVQAAAGVGAKGFVQGIVTYTVMDNLTVTPMSSISTITLLNTFGVKDLTALQEKTVLVGYAEGLEILKASLQSNTVLTDVFLGEKSPGGA